MTRRSNILLGVSVFAIALAALAWAVREKIARRASPNTPEARLFSQVRFGFLEVGYSIKTVLSTNSQITTWSALCVAIAATSSGIKIDPTNANPFPDDLPAGKYGRCLTFDRSRETDPVIWRRLRLEEDLVLYVSSKGDIKSVPAADFKKLIGSFTNQTAFDP